MTKLEEKLIELGYEIEDTTWNYKYAFKSYNFKCDIDIYFYKKGEIYYYRAKSIGIKTQQDIDDLQQAFNEMQKDLAILKEVQ